MSAEVQPGLFPDPALDILCERGGDGDMLRTAWLSDDGRYRWTLMRHWDSRPHLGWIMLNPSTADALVDDPTIRRCIGFARALGFGGITVTNLCALRTPDPKVLAAEGWDAGGRRNDKVLRALLSESVRNGGMVIAAWGANAQRDRVEWLAAQPYADRLRALSITKKGAPGHPLYLRSDCLPIPWRLA